MAWTYDNQDWARVNNGVIELKNADGSWSAAGTPGFNTNNSKCYLPAQVASGNTFTLCGSYEI